MGMVAWQSTTLKVIGDLRLIWDCKFWGMMIFQWRRKIVAKPEKGFLKCHQDFVQTNKSIIPPTDFLSKHGSKIIALTKTQQTILRATILSLDEKNVAAQFGDLANLCHNWTCAFCEKVPNIRLIWEKRFAKL